jgi:hypothetical protein
MHFAWALLLLINARSWKTQFVLGEHYFIDLIAALPSILAIQRIAILCSEAMLGKFMPNSFRFETNECVRDQKGLRSGLKGGCAANSRLLA